MRLLKIHLALFLAVSNLSAQVTDEDAKQTILPSLELNKTPLRDTLDFLQQRTAELREVSSSNPVPKTRIIRELSFTRDTKNGVGNTLVTFHAENITVWDALTRILTPLELEIAVDEAGHMTVVPKSAPK